MRAAQQRTATMLYESTALQAVLKMGAGKTAAALTAIKELLEDGHIRAALVVAPRKVSQLVWPAEPKLWEHLCHLKVCYVSGPPEQRRKLLLSGGYDIYSIGVDNLPWLLKLLADLPADHYLFDLLCIDELSTLKSPRGKRAQKMRDNAKRWKTIWGLTGTPRPNGYEDQFMPMAILTRGKLWGKKFDQWRAEHFAPENNDFKGGRVPLDQLKWEIRPEHEAKIAADISSVSITLADDDMPELPPLTSVFHWVDLPPKIMAYYRTMERDFVAKYKDNPAVMAANIAVASGKLCQIVQGFVYEDDVTVQLLHTEKADMLVELVEGLNGNPVLLTYEFKEDLQVLEERWPGLPYLGAGVSDKKVAQYEKQWNASQLPILGLHPASAGHGLNLQHGGSQMIWYGMTWSAELYEQTLKRFHRPGQRLHCFAHHILARGTIDEVKYNRVVGKMTAQQAFETYLRRV